MLRLEEIISSLYPELIVLFALVLSILLSNTRLKNIIWIITALLLTSATIYIVKYQLNLPEQIQILGGMFILDKLSVLFRLITVATALLIVLGSVKYTEGFTHKSEFLIIFLGALLGIMFLVSANDLITLFVALETLSLSSVILAGYSKYDIRSNEASLKYLLNSAGASAIFLFGLSIIYGLTGSTQFYEIKFRFLELIKNGSINPSVILIVLILIVGGLAFKLASAPMHMWSPDVYEGAPTPVTAFLSVTSKAAAFAVSVRLLFILFDFAINIWQPLIVTLAILSMVIGNLVALGEVMNKASIKRLMAYSSIAQIGYILMGLALGTDSTISASIFYLIIYSVVNLGAFLCIIAFGNEANSDSINSYSGLMKKRAALTLVFSLCLFNLGGLPVPPAGFIAKFILLQASFQSGLLGIVLGSVALLTTIISIYYYSYIAKIMIVDEPSKEVAGIDSNKEALGKSFPLNSAIAITIAGILIAFIFSHPLLKMTNKTALSMSSQSTFISLK